MTRRDSSGHKGMKKADFKIGSFLTKNPGLTPWRNVDFWRKYKYYFRSFQSNQCVQTGPLRHFLGLPRDQGKRDSPQKIKSGLEFKRKFFVTSLFGLKNDSQECFATRPDP